MVAKSALVAGGTGGIGEGIVKVLLDGGWTVFVPVRGQETGERLRAYAGGGDRLRIVKADLSVRADVAALHERVRGETPSLGLVVVSVGSSYYGYSLHKIPQKEWERLITENLATHFNVQHEFLAQLHEQNEGTYVTLTGPEADFTYPETGLMSVLAAAQKMMARVEALEASGTGVRVYSVTSRRPIATRVKGEQGEPDWIHPEELGRYVEALALSRAPECNEPLHVLETRSQVRGLLKLS
jgi:NAD(P)-dependent dehydrogenase (short-subunit alcohol dehydrogenase family)